MNKRKFVFFMKKSFDLLFDMFGHEAFHIGRRGARVNGGYKNLGYHNVWKLLFRQCVVGKKTGERNNNGNDKNARTVIDGPTGGFEFFHC